MPRILIVDDSATDRCMVGSLVAQDTRAEIDYAFDGLDALAAIGRQRPDLVITDLVMPRMNGLELTAEVRRGFPGVPIILMTSQGNEEIAVEALQRGAASYVSKSKLAVKMLDTVQMVLAASDRLQSQARLERYLVRSRREFVLENDPSLFGPLLACLQEESDRFQLWDDSERTRVGIALQEALTNAVFHGNLELSGAMREEDEDAYHSLAVLRRHQSPYAERQLRVEADFSHAEARFVIRDEGPGFNPHLLPDPTDPANLERVSGRGILLMRTFMDKVEFNQMGNQVAMAKFACRPAQPETTDK